MDLADLLQSFVGNSNVAGGPTANQVTTQGNQPSGGANPLGVSPLARSLLAAYFAGIGSPKLAGTYGAISRGGLAGLNEYDSAMHEDEVNLLRQQQMATEKQRSDLYGKQVDLEEQKLNQKAEAPIWVNTKTGVGIRSHDKPGPDYIDYDTWASMQRDAAKPSTKETTGDKLQAKQDAANKAPIGNDKFFTRVDPITLKPHDDLSISNEEADSMGLKKITRKDAAGAQGYLDALDTLEQMRTHAADVFPKKDDLGVTGTFGAGVSSRLDKNFNPEKYAPFDADVAGLAGVPRIVLGGNRMNLTEWNGVMSHLAGAKNYGSTQEAVNGSIDELEAIIKKRLKAFSPSYGGDDSTPDSGSPAGTDNSATQVPTTSPNFIPGTKARRVN